MEVLADLRRQQCPDHEGQKICLFCIHDRKLICDKCVRHHQGHPMYDLEYTATSLIIPDVKALSKRIEEFNQESKQMDEFIVEKEKLRKYKLGQDLKNLRDLSQKLQDMVKNKMQKLIDLRFEMENKEFQLLDQQADPGSRLQIQEYMQKVQSLCDEQLNLGNKRRYFELVALHLEINLDGFVIDSNFNSLKFEINKEFQDSCASINSIFDLKQQQILSTFDTLLNEVIKQPAKPMPQLFFIEEIQNTFQYYDFDLMTIAKKKIQFHKQIPLFSGIGSIQGRIFTFGGKDSERKQITNDSYEILYDAQSNITLQRRSCMYQKRSRSAVAQVDRSIMNQKPFLVIIGGSDFRNQATGICELYCPERDQFYFFPQLNDARENPSCCLFETAQHQLYIYLFSGFNKEPVKTVERVLLQFEEGVGSQQYPILKGNWELLHSLYMHPSVECCGTFQRNSNEIIIYGGFQRELDDLTNITIFDTEDMTFTLNRSELKESDSFILPPVLRRKALIQEQKDQIEEMKGGEQEIKDSRLFAWSKYGNVHVLDFETMQWSIFKKKKLDCQPQQYLDMQLKRDPQS